MRRAFWIAAIAVLGAGWFLLIMAGFAALGEPSAVWFMSLLQS